MSRRFGVTGRRASLDVPPGTERCVMDRRPPGYRWIELGADGSFASEVGRLDHLVGEPRDEGEWRG